MIIDPMFRDIVQFVNEHKASLDMEVVVNGSVVSGTLIDRITYLNAFEELEEKFLDKEVRDSEEYNNGGPNPQFFEHYKEKHKVKSDSLVNLFKEVTSKYTNPKLENISEFCHFKDVHIHIGEKTDRRLSFFRCSLSSVNGFSLKSPSSASSFKTGAARW